MTHGLTYGLRETDFYNRILNFLLRAMDFSFFSKLGISFNEKKRIVNKVSVFIFESVF